MQSLVCLDLISGFFFEKILQAEENLLNSFILFGGTFNQIKGDLDGFQKF